MRFMTYLFHRACPIKSKKLLLLVTSCLIVAGCSSSGPKTNTVSETAQTSKTIGSSEFRESSLFSIYNQWQGVPYRLGGTSKNGIDCSAFVQIAYRDAWQLPLPRTTKLQSKIGNNINYKDAKYGDLVFFKTSRSTNHVGVYLGNSRFMHASTSKGVIISRLDNPYWASKFWQFRRVDTQIYWDFER